METRRKAPTTTTGTKDSAVRPAPRTHPSAEVDASFNRHPVLRLQRSAGNQAVLQVLRRSAPAPSAGAHDVPPIVRTVLAGGGRPLDSSDRGFLEPRLGRDLGDVRIHTDAAAAESARAVGADAYTVGSDVVFAAGRHRPETRQGRRLLAHELAHTLQQTAGPGAGGVSPSSTIRVGEPRDVHEDVADRIADQVIDTTQPATIPSLRTVSTVPQPTLQRQSSSSTPEEPQVKRDGNNVYVLIGETAIAEGVLPEGKAVQLGVAAQYEPETGIRHIKIYVPAGGTLAFVPGAEESLTAGSSKFFADIVHESSVAAERGTRTEWNVEARLNDPRPTPTMPAPVLAAQRQPPPPKSQAAPGLPATDRPHHETPPAQPAPPDSATPQAESSRVPATIPAPVASAQNQRSDVSSPHPQNAQPPEQTAVPGAQDKRPARPPIPAPTPNVVADNPLVSAMSVFASIHPSSLASGLYEGMYQGRRISLNQTQYDALRARVRGVVLDALDRASRKVDSAAGRYEEQQKVDAQHWIVAPIVKALGNVADPGPNLLNYVQIARLSLSEARAALDSGDFVLAARFVGDGEAGSRQAELMVAAYVDQIIGSAELTVTVLEGIKTASEIVLFLCAVAATGGAAGAGATALGLEGAGGVTTLFGITGSTATWATVVGTSAAITQEVALGIAHAADGDQVHWDEIATHAAIQVIVAKFSPSLGQRLTKQLAKAAVASPVLRELIARVGIARVVTVATNLLLHEGSQLFATAVEESAGALGGQKITWGQFAENTLVRLTDPKGILTAILAGALGGTHPEPTEEPKELLGSTVPPPEKSPTDNAHWRDVNRDLGLSKSATASTGGTPLQPSKTDNADWRDVNRAVGITKPRTITATPVNPPPGAQAVTAEQVFLPTPAERAAAFAEELASKTPPVTNAEQAFRPTPAERQAAFANETVFTAQGAPVLESANSSPKGPEFQSASSQTRRSFRTSTRADIGEAQGYKAALVAGEIGLERPQGVNVSNRADFITAARDVNGEMWVIANDAKTRSSSSSEFEAPKPGLRPGWDAQVKAAVDRASLGNPQIEAEIQAAYKAGRIWVRQVHVDLSPAGQGAVSGIAPPSPVPWGALLGPLDLERRRQ